MLAPLLSLSLAISSPEVTYIGWDHVLLHHPTTGTYTIQHYARYSRPPCVGLAGEPRFIGNVGMLGQRFVALGKGTLLQLDPVKGSFALRQCSTADRLALGLRIACPVVLEGQPQAAFANVSLLAATDDVLLVHNTSQLSTATLRGYRIRRGAGFTPAGAFGFEKLKLAGLVWRESFGRHALTPMGKQLVFDYESEAPSHFRIWRLNPSCAAGKPCNSATDPPLQGPLHEGTFPHAGRAFVGLSHDAPDDVSVLHLMELDPASATYRVLVCDSARLGGHDAPLPCSYYQSRTPLLQPSPCMARADRASCLAHEGCGWCASASVCLLGNEVSPCSGGCPPEAWVGREPDTNATRSQPGEWDPRPAGAHVVGASASDAGVAPRLLDGGGELSVRLAMAVPFGASSLAVSSTVGLGVGSLVRLSPGTDAEEDHVVGQLSDDGRLQLLGSTWHAQPQGAGVALLAAGDPSVLERLRDGLMPTATAIAAAANPNATDAGVAAVETLVYLGGDSVLQLLPQGQYALWKLARPGVESRAPSGVTRAPPRNGFEEAPAAQGLLPAPRLATGTPAAQLVFTGAASCGGVTDDGCDTFVAFEAASGRYFRFQRRPSQASPTALAAFGVGGAYELKAQGSWPTMASRQLLYVGHNVLWAWSAELCDLRAYRYKSHRQRGANASASVGEVGGAAEAAVFMGAWRLPADLKGESLTFLRTMPDDGLVVSYDPHAPPPVKARVWLPTPRADDGASSGGGGGGGGTGRPLQRRRCSASTCGRRRRGSWWGSTRGCCSSTRSAAGATRTRCTASRPTARRWWRWRAAGSAARSAATRACARTTGARRACATCGAATATRRAAASSRRRRRPAPPPTPPPAPRRSARTRTRSAPTPRRSRSCRPPRSPCRRLAHAASGGAPSTRSRCSRQQGRSCSGRRPTASISSGRSKGSATAKARWAAATRRAAAARRRRARRCCPSARASGRAPACICCPSTPAPAPRARREEGSSCCSSTTAAAARTGC